MDNILNGIVYKNILEKTLIKFQNSMKLVYELKLNKVCELKSYSTTKTVLRGKTLVERQLLQLPSDSVTDCFLAFQLGFSYWLALQQMDPPQALQDKSTMIP